MEVNERTGGRPATALGLLGWGLLTSGGHPLADSGHVHNAAGERRIIVDTDAALDDLRALALLFARPHIRVLGIVTSDGSAAPEEGARRVREALRCLGRSGIPIGVGDVLAEQLDAARLRPDQTDDFLEQHRFAGAAAADQRNQLAAADRQVDPVVDRLRAEASGEEFGP